MREFRLSKSQVLKEFYVRELPLIIREINERNRDKQLEEFMRWNRLLKIAVATAGMSPSEEAVKDIFEELRKSVKPFVPSKTSGESEKPKDPYEQLKKLQGIIGQTRQKMKR
jgi:hypothetical protein